MTYIENIFLCMVSPLLVAALCMGRRQLRFFLFCIAGMGVCLLSAYINTFLAVVCQADALAATAEIAPVVEEMMKLLPLVFYLLVFEPEGDKIKAAAITVALTFATFENVCYLIQNGADRFSFIFFRGFGTGAMHVLCGLIVGGGLAYTWRRTWLKIAGTCGLLGTAIAFDGPPVGAYGLCMGWEPRVLLGTLGVFFVLRATVTLVLQGMAGFYTPTVLTCAMYGAPGVILGTCIAFPVVKHISQQAFRKVLLCVIAVAGLGCLVRALG